MSGRLDPDGAAALSCLAALPAMTHSRLASLLAHHSPCEALAAVVGVGDVRGPVRALLARDPSLARRWRDAVDRRPVEAHRHALARLGVDVLVPDDPRFPAALVHDRQRPAALFVRGDLAALDRRRVAVVGTRNATHRGCETAARVGFELAAADVAVVSGLALGIDGAAHRGALAAAAAPPVAVVGSGPDVVYPRRHADLWRRVIESGLLISEWPPGVAPEAYRFPLRNRLIAALSEIVVVVESRTRGGSLITVREAIERGVDVFAVPGAVDAPASAGTNLLLRDGAAPLTDTGDLLLALGLDGRRAGGRRIDTRPPPRGLDANVLAACRAAPLTVDRVADRLALSLADAALSLARLEQAGWLREVAGWFEPCDVYADLV